jgi:predicted lysophospholipase L1 biosynthesis ABC-type transport system permease subunit
MKLRSLFSFSWRMLRRDARGGELRLLAAALVVAVAALTAVGFFTDRVRQALERESHQLLGADLLLVSDQPWPATFADEARAGGLQVAETWTFPEHGQSWRRCRHAFAVGRGQSGQRRLSFARLAARCASTERP